MSLAGSATSSKVGLTRDGAIYRVGSLLVHPKPSELALASAYLRFHYEGTLPAIMHESGLGLSAYLSNCQKWPVLACMRVVDESAQQYDPLGLGWMEPKGDGKLLRKGECGLSYFRKAPPADTITLTRMMLTWNFEMNDMDLIYTEIPEMNRASIAHTKRAGLAEYGTIPMFTVWEGAPCGSVVLGITRASWEIRVKEWF